MPSGPSLAQALAAAPIKSVIRRDETIVRLGGVGDNYHMSWTAADRQITAVCDGTGWFERPKALYNSRLFTISGGPHDAAFQDVPSYPDLIADLNTEEVNRYYGFGTLALDGQIYQFLSTPNHKFFEVFGGAPIPGARFVGAKLIYSPDHGQTWCNQDGSTPVVWEPRPERSRANMIFFEEDQDAFSLISLLQMGRGYSLNRDGYVYGYSPNGSIEGTMNQLVLFRVPKGRIREREAYQFFGGFKSQDAHWTSDMAARVPILSFPPGWVNKALHPWAWMPSVTYNAALGVYMMVSWGNGRSPTGEWFGKPSYLGFWTSATPWGPWVQVHEETAWTPGGDSNARAFAPQISPKWIAQDGKSFWLVWSDFQGAEAAAQPWHVLGEKMPQMNRVEQGQAMSQFFRRYLPYYAFNAQRVDLIIE